MRAPHTDFTLEEQEFFENACVHYEHIMTMGADELCKLYLKTQDVTKVLDVACGTGILSHLVSKRNENCEITLVDVSSKLLAKAAERHQFQVKVVQSDIFNYFESCGGCEFDIIVSGYFIHNLVKPLKQRIFEEVGRILKDGGLFLLVDKVCESNLIDLRAINHTFQQFITFAYSQGRSPRADENLAFWIQHYLEDENSELRFSEDDLKEFIRAANLKPRLAGKRFLMDQFFVFER